jgi:hypothetical protein
MSNGIEMSASFGCDSHVYGVLVVVIGCGYHFQSLVLGVFSTPSEDDE